MFQNTCMLAEFCVHHTLHAHRGACNQRRKKAHHDEYPLSREYDHLMGFLCVLLGMRYLLNQPLHAVMDGLHALVKRLDLHSRKM